MINAHIPTLATIWMDYTTVYEITNENPDLILGVPLVLAIGGFLAFYITIRKNKLVQKKSKDSFTLFLALGFGIVFTIVSANRIPNSLKKLKEHKQVFLEGSFKTIEGKIQNFEPMPYQGHKNEQFLLNGIPFAYSDFQSNYYGFQNTASHGGPIKYDGQEIRLGYFSNLDGENIIVKVEIKR